LEPRLSDITEHSVIVELSASEPAGALWSYLSEADVVLSSAELKAGSGRLASSSPVDCARLGMAISTEIFPYSMSQCGMLRGESYAFNAYVESDDGGTVFREVFVVPADPVPLPNGPFCYDIDVDYLGASVAEVLTAVPDAEACQALCEASGACLHFRYVHSSALAEFQTCSLLSSGPTSGMWTPSEGLTMGPKSCASRSVNTLRPSGSRVGSSPTVAVRSVPFTLLVDGVNLDHHHDRVILTPLGQPCGVPARYGQVPAARHLQRHGVGVAVPCWPRT